MALGEQDEKIMAQARRSRRWVTTTGMAAGRLQGSITRVRASSPRIATLRKRGLSAENVWISRKEGDTRWTNARLVRGRKFILGITEGTACLMRHAESLGSTCMRGARAPVTFKSEKCTELVNTRASPKKSCLSFLKCASRKQRTQSRRICRPNVTITVTK